MVQSVEFLLDRDAEAAVSGEWDALADAGLPTSRRPDPPPSHRPHLTLLAVEQVSDRAEAELARLLAGVELEVRIGAPLLFTKPRRDRLTLILVRQVIPSIELLRLQRAVVEIAGPGLGADFAAGRWTPHVTLARRVAADQVGPAVAVLAGHRPSAERDARLMLARRWDGDVKRDWLL